MLSLTMQNHIKCRHICYLKVFSVMTYTMESHDCLLNNTRTCNPCQAEWYFDSPQLIWLTENKWFHGIQNALRSPFLHLQIKWGPFCHSVLSWSKLNCLEMSSLKDYSQLIQPHVLHSLTSKVTSPWLPCQVHSQNSQFDPYFSLLIFSKQVKW